MTKVTVNISGVDKLLAKVQSYRASKRAEIQSLLDATAITIESDAKTLAPVDTGRLRSSIRWVRPSEFSRVVGSDVRYAPFVEFGTVRQRAQPYLVPAYEANRQKFINSLRQIVRTL